MEALEYDLQSIQQSNEMLRGNIEMIDDALNSRIRVLEEEITIEREDR